MTHLESLHIRPKDILKVVLIIFLAFSLWAGIVVSVFWIQGQSLKYVDDLRGVKLSQISGEVKTVSESEYLEEMKVEKIDTSDPSQPALFPSKLPGEGADFFYFSEWVAKTKKRIEFVGRYTSAAHGASKTMKTRRIDLRRLRAPKGTP